MLSAAEIPSPLGRLILMADDQGLCRIVLPGCGPVRDHRTIAIADHPLLAEAGRQIGQYFAGSRTAFQLRLSIAGTEFQRAVWRLLTRIPYGTTKSYGALARELGGVGKARAVGAAAHANPLPLVIPCHRLVGADGSLTGFAGGLELKRQLLRHEGIPGANRKRQRKL